MYDRLGEHVGHFPRNQEELKEMANARVPDEFIFCRDSNIHRVYVKQSSLSAGLEDKASPMVSKRINKDAEEEDVAGTSGRLV